jgi:hypothetical protein
MNRNTTGKDNVAIGNASMYGTAPTDSTGDGNVAVGFETLNTNISGDFNCAFGIGVLGKNTSGLGNTAVGAGALAYNTTGSGNVALGYEALFNVANIGNDYNTALGDNAGTTLTTGSNNIMIGRLANVPIPTGSNQIAIGTSAETMYIQGGFNWRVGTQITGTISLATLPLAQFYPVAMGLATQTITLPDPNGTTLLGATVTFKRLGNTTQFDLATVSGTYFVPINSIGTSATITVSPTIFQVTLVCSGGFWCIINYV